jgi:hypothetical protein
MKIHKSENHQTRSFRVGVGPLLPAAEGLDNIDEPEEDHEHQDENDKNEDD